MKREKGKAAEHMAEWDRKQNRKEQLKTGAVVLAGGSGRRMKSTIPKQYMILNGRPMITYGLEAFEKSPVDQIVLVTGEDEVEFCRNEIVAAYGFEKVKAVVPGGKERYHSVYEGLKALEGCSHVLIHDGARPLISQRIIQAALEGAFRYRACVVGMPVKDTIKVSDEEEFASNTPDRKYLWQIQTPQAFEYQLVRSCYEHLMEDIQLQQGITDDAMVVESFSGVPVKLIRGDYSNIKVTTPEDIFVAEALLTVREQTGQF